MSFVRRYTKTTVLFLMMGLFGLALSGPTDSRLHIGGYEWEYSIDSLSGAGSPNAEGDVDSEQPQVAVGPPNNSTQDTAEGKDRVSLSGTEEASKSADEPSADGETEGSASADELQVADQESVPKIDKVVDSVENDQPILVHTVKAGETLWDIAQAYGITVDSILSTNDIPNSNRIRVGQKLEILRVQGVLHPVADGESLWEISNRYRVSIDEIARANGITNPSRIQPNERLIIPGATRLMPRDVLVVNGQLQRAFAWPTTGRISSPFGPRWGGMHHGIDIAVPTGTPIRAAANGRVTYSGWNGGYGIMVMIDHGNGVETRYAHHSRNIVSVGQVVERNQVIAYSGNTGNSTGPHLHFEIRHRNQAVDPKSYLQ